MPNEPIVFDDDPTHKRRTEDAIIAWTWYKFLLEPSSDPIRLVRFPMVKAGFQALRALEEFAAQQFQVTVDQFGVAGASKRGWVTWLMGAVSPPGRVICIMPLVLDVLNLDAVLHHQFRSYGGWTWAFADYLALNVTAFMDTPAFLAMRQQIDPIMPQYASRLTMPKFVVVSSDDEFMQLDDSNYWWGQLPGETNLMIAVNSEHSLITAIPEVVPSLIAFYDSVRKNGTRPRMTWEKDDATGTITLRVYSRPLPGQVTVRQAQTLSSTMRDFRWIIQPAECLPPNFMVGGRCVQPILWFEDVMTTNSTTFPLVYTAQYSPPQFGGWQAFFFDVAFPSDTGLKVNYRMTSQAVVVPDTFPFPDCHEQSCTGHIV